jgi:hypothetical protein
MIQHILLKNFKIKFNKNQFPGSRVLIVGEIHIAKTTVIFFNFSIHRPEISNLTQDKVVIVFGLALISICKF